MNIQGLLPSKIFPSRAVLKTHFSLPLAAERPTDQCKPTAKQNLLKHLLSLARLVSGLSSAHNEGDLQWHFSISVLGTEWHQETL